MAGAGVFPKVAGDTIYAADYNLIYNNLAAVLGVGSSTSGYGNFMSGDTRSADTALAPLEWLDLKTDILRARKHQIGAGTAYDTLVAQFTTIETAINGTGKVTIATTNTFKTTVDTIVTNKDTAHPTQLTKITGASSTYTPSWNGAITQVVTVTFSSADNARNFFNAGGYLINDLSSAGSSGSAKDNDWDDILAAGTGGTYTKTDYRRTAANTVIVSATYGSSYAQNYFKAWGERVNATTIKITTLFDDASIIGGTLGNPGSGTVYDESVTLNITSAVNYYKSFDAIVSPTPDTVSAGAFSVVRSDTATAGQYPGFGGGGAVGTYSVVANGTTIGETGTLQFTFNQNGYTGARTCYYEATLASTVSAADFQAGSAGLSGSITFAAASDAVARSFFMSADALTEGTEYLQIRLYADSGKTVLLAQSQQVTITDTSTGTALSEALTGVGATFTIGATLTYSLTGGTPNSTATYSWTGIKPDGTNYTGLSGGTVTLNGSGSYSQSGAFLTGPGTFTLSVTFNATGTVRTSTTVSEIPATLTLSTQTSLGQDQIRLAVTSNYGYTHSYTTTLSAGATFDSYTGNLPNSTLSGGATSAAMNLVNPHSASTATCSITMPYCNPLTLTVSIPANTEVVTVSPTTANDGDPLAVTITGGTPSDFYDYYYQSDLTYSPSDPGYAYRAIGQVPFFSTTDNAVNAANGWGGLSATAQTDAVLSSTGTKNIPTQGVGLYPANYRVWARFGQTGHLRYIDFTVNQTNGTVSKIAVSGTLTATPAAYANGSGAGDTSVGLNINATGLLANEFVDIAVKPVGFAYTTNFLTNHSTWYGRNLPLSNGVQTVQSYQLTKGYLYSAGANVQGRYVLWVYFINSGQYRTWDFQVS